MHSISRVEIRRLIFYKNPRPSKYEKRFPPIQIKTKFSSRLRSWGGLRTLLTNIPLLFVGGWWVLGIIYDKLAFCSVLFSFRTWNRAQIGTDQTRWGSGQDWLDRADDLEHGSDSCMNRVYLICFEVVLTAVVRKKPRDRPQDNKRVCRRPLITWEAHK